MTSSKRSLFGGALLAAGLTASAQAQNFNFSYTGLAYVGAFDYSDGSPFDYAYGFGVVGFFSYTASVESAYGRLQGSAQNVNALGKTSAKSYLGGGLDFGSYFTVDSNTLADINWDFSGDQEPGGNWVDSYLTIDDLSLGSNVFFADLNNPIGSTQIALDSSHQYRIGGFAISLNGNGTTYWDVTIPSPGSAGILGLAGLTAARRRRARNE